MANEFARNIRDAATIVTRALTASDGTVTSSDIDLGAGDYLTENLELLIEVPALSSSELASADTLTLTVQHGDSAAPSTSTGISYVITGDGNAVPAQSFRVRLPANCGRYVNVKAVTAGTTGNMSAKSLTISLLY